MSRALNRQRLATLSDAATILAILACLVEFLPLKAKNQRWKVI